MQTPPMGEITDLGLKARGQREAGHATCLVMYEKARRSS